MQVAWLPSLFTGPHNCCQLRDIIHSHNVDVVFTTESLDEGEVDLKGNIPLVILICRQQAESYGIWITAEKERATRVAVSSGGRASRVGYRKAISALPPPHTRPKPSKKYSHIHQLGGLVDSCGQAAATLRGDQQLLQGFAGALHQVAACGAARSAAAEKEKEQKHVSRGSESPARISAFKPGAAAKDQPAGRQAAKRPPSRPSPAPVRLPRCPRAS